MAAETTTVETGPQRGAAEPTGGGRWPLWVATAAIIVLVVAGATWVVLGVRTQVTAGSVGGPTTVHGAANATVSAPSWSGRVIEHADRIAIGRMISVRNEGPRPASITDVDGVRGTWVDDHPCRLDVERAAVFVVQDHAYGTRDQARPYEGDLELAPGEEAQFWLDGTFHGEGCEPDSQLMLPSVTVDYRVGGREDITSVEADHLVFVSDLDAWLDDAFRVQRHD